MDVGMLWYYGDSEKDLADCTAEAVAYYQNKYGRAPTHGFYHEDVKPEDLPVVEGMQLGTGKVQPDHIWIGTQTSGGTE